MLNPSTGLTVTGFVLLTYAVYTAWEHAHSTSYAISHLPLSTPLTTLPTATSFHSLPQKSSQSHIRAEACDFLTNLMEKVTKTPPDISIPLLLAIFILIISTSVLPARNLNCIQWSDWAAQCERETARTRMIEQAGLTPVCLKDHTRSFGRTALNSDENDQSKLQNSPRMWNPIAALEIRDGFLDIWTLRQQHQAWKKSTR